MTRALLTAALRAPVAQRTWRAAGYALVGLPMAVPVFALPLLGLVFAPLSLAGVGLPVLAAVLLAARATAGWFRWPARALLGWDWPSPPPVRRGGPVRTARAVLVDGHAWRALVYCLVKLPLAALTAYLTVLAVGGGLYCLTCPVWWPLLPTGLGPLHVDGWGGTWYAAAAGACALLAFPWLLAGLVAVDHRLATALLAPSPAGARIAQLESDRAVLAADAATTLRRVERDLHDGTQARLVSVGMALSRIEHRLGLLPPAVIGTTDLPALLGAARGTVDDALTELRDIVRRIHPPALDDGLTVALTTLAARGGVPAEVTVDLAEPPADAAATTLYFAAAELLTNAGRHAEATRVRLHVSEDGDRLRLVVADDGRGGAAARPGGTGLAGLSRRAAALDGRLDIDSPAGGPTTVTVTLPRGG